MRREFGAAAGAASSPAYGPREASKASAARRTIPSKILWTEVARAAVTALAATALLALVFLVAA